MANIVSAFEVAYEDIVRKGWTERIYVFVDIHSTVIKPTYSKTEDGLDYYEHAKDTLKYLSDRKDIVLIYYSCTPMDRAVAQVAEFAKDGIIFDYINENPEVTTSESGYGDYSMKPYFNVLLDDKAGFDPSSDWVFIWNYYYCKEKEKARQACL